MSWRAVKSRSSEAGRTEATLVRLQTELNRLSQTEPYERRALSGGVFDLASRQHRQSGQETSRRALDRLHLAAMQELGLSRRPEIMEMETRQV